MCNHERDTNWIIELLEPDHHTDRLQKIIQLMPGPHGAKWQSFYEPGNGCRMSHHLCLGRAANIDGDNLAAEYMCQRQMEDGEVFVSDRWPLILWDGELVELSGEWSAELLHYRHGDIIKDFDVWLESEAQQHIADIATASFPPDLIDELLPDLMTVLYDAPKLPEIAAASNESLSAMGAEMALRAVMRYNSM